jgi:hypothetical protein
MTLSSDAPVPAPDGPPLATMARIGTMLHVTVLHASLADLLWQHRQRLTEDHGCSGLRLIVLDPSLGGDKPPALEWQCPSSVGSGISWRRR